MTSAPVVSNASPLIALEQIGHLDLLEAISLATALHLPVIGTLGILLAAKRRWFLTVIGPCLGALLQHDFRISPRLYRNVLHAAGEDSRID
jgi:predicted nucleic acid-binding protein